MNVQNLAEAEYVVAVYQYMRLLGYPASSISILTTYNGQKGLIEDVLTAVGSVTVHCHMQRGLIVAVWCVCSGAGQCRSLDVRRPSPPWTATKASRMTIFCCPSCAPEALDI
jgi:hypothetical protein